LLPGGDPSNKLSGEFKFGSYQPNSIYTRTKSKFITFKKTAQNWNPDLFYKSFYKVKNILMGIFRDIRKIVSDYRHCAICRV
jgi:hypothetical protein